MTDATLNKFRFPILGIGGQSIGAGQNISPYYQLLYGWKIRPQEANHILTVDGNIITDDGTDPFVSTVGNYNVRVKLTVSSNSLTTSGGALTATQDSNLKKALKIGQFLALK